MYCYIVLQKIWTTVSYSTRVNSSHLFLSYKLYSFICLNIINVFILSYLLKLIYCLEFRGSNFFCLLCLFLMLLDFFLGFVIFVYELIFNRKHLLLRPLVFFGLYKHHYWSPKGQFSPEQSLDYFSFPQCVSQPRELYFQKLILSSFTWAEAFLSHGLELVGRVAAPISCWELSSSSLFIDVPWLLSSSQFLFEVPTSAFKPVYGLVFPMGQCYGFLSFFCHLQTFLSWFCTLQCFGVVGVFLSLEFLCVQNSGLYCFSSFDYLELSTAVIFLQFLSQGTGSERLLFAHGHMARKWQSWELKELQSLWSSFTFLNRFVLEANPYINGDQIHDIKLTKIHGKTGAGF